MKSAFALLALGVGALIAQGAVATFLAPPWAPDLVLLVLVGIGLRWEGSMAAGFLLAGAIGYASDLLSGSLLGQHALLALFAFGATVLATRQLNLRGSVPLAFFTAVLTFVYGLAMWGTTSFFAGPVGIGGGWLLDQLAHAVVCGLAAPAVSGAVGRVRGWVGDEDAARRSLGDPLRASPRAGPARRPVGRRADGRALP